MIPQAGQYVKIYFKNGMHTEGTLMSFSEDTSVIAMPDNKSSCVIMKTKEDVMTIQVFHDVSETKVGLKEHMSELEEQFQDTYQLPSNDDLRLKKLSDLKKMMIEQEKKIIHSKVVDHSISDATRPQYGLPNIFKK